MDVIIICITMIIISAMILYVINRHIDKTDAEKKVDDLMEIIKEKDVSIQNLEFKVRSSKY